MADARPTPAVLNGLFDHLIQRQNAYVAHLRTCDRNCDECIELAARWRHARTEYYAALDRAFRPPAP
jgi:hypothetical protein